MFRLPTSECRVTPTHWSVIVTSVQHVRHRVRLVTFTTMALPQSELLQLKRWNTPTIYNGWEQITKHNSCEDAFNIEETRDFMPQMGPMVGYAVTVVIEPSNPKHRAANPNALE